MKPLTLILAIMFLSCCTKRNEHIFEQAKHIDFADYNILCLGNSLTYGYQSSDPYPAQLSRLIPAAIVTNKGVSGCNTGQMIGWIGRDVIPNYRKGMRNMAIVWEISNDLGGCSDTLAYQHYVTYCDSLQHLGWTVISVSVIYRDNSVLFPQYNWSFFDPERLTINGWLRSNFGQFSYKLADVAADSSLAHFDPRYFYPDHIHLIAAGDSIVASIVRQVIE